VVSPHAPRVVSAPRCAATALRLLVVVLSAALLPSLAPRALAAQQRVPARPDSVGRVDSLSPDSLAARLARAEAAIALLRQQLAAESQSAVRTRSRFALELDGRVLTNAFATSNRVNSVDVPLVALLPNDADDEGRVLALTLRQSRVGVALSVTEVLGGTFQGDVDADFSGGASSGPGDRRLFPEPRLRTARARVIWPRGELMVGSETPLISDLNPVSLAAVAFPGFVAAGNLWNWLPQLRATRELGAIPVGRTALRWAVQGAVLEPFSGSPYPGEADAVDAGERTGRPYLEGRLRARWGEPSETPASDASIASGGGEVGVGVHHGWVTATEGVRRTSRALAMDARVSITPTIELRGEAYTGRLVRGLGGGGIGQNFGQPAAAGEAIGPPVDDVAGWAQLNVQAHPLLITGAGCGVDRVDDDDRPLRTRNANCAVHLLWRPTQPIVVGAEYRALRTRYAAGGTARADHFNLAFGFEF